MKSNMETPNNVFQSRVQGEVIEIKDVSTSDDGEKVLHEIMSSETRDGDVLEETVSLGVPGEDEESENNVFQSSARGEVIEIKNAPTPDDGEKVLHEIMSSEMRDTDGDVLEETVSLGVPGEDEELENKEWLYRKAA